MKCKRVLAAIMAAILVFGLAFAAMAQEHEPVTLTLIHEHSEEAAANVASSAAYRYCMDIYKKEHPWVTLEETLISNADIQEKYTTLIAADELPDLSYVKRTWLPSTAGEGMLVDLTDYIDPANYYDGLSWVTYEGRIWAMPNKYSVYNLFVYNTKLWAEAGYPEGPASFEELIAADEKFNEMGINTISLGNAAKWFAVAYFTDALAYDYCGADWVDKIVAGDSSVAWTDQCFVDAMTALAQLTPLFNADFNMTDDISAARMYMEGKAASHVVGGWGVSTLKGMAEEFPETWENTRVILVPTANGAESTLINASGAAMGVSSRLLEEGRENELQAAIEFCQTISSPYYAQYCSEHGMTTPYKTTYDWESLGRQFMDLADIINTYTNTGMHFGDFLNDTVKLSVQDETQSLLAGAVTPEAACANIQAVQEMVFAG